MEPVKERSRAAVGRRVLAAAERILRDDGYSGLTMERVAAESGVAKTTLYRRWPTKAALCMSLYLDVAERELHDPDTGDITDDLKQITRTVVHLHTKSVAGPALIGMIAEAQLNPDSSSAVLADFAQRRREITKRVIARAIERGQLDAGVDGDLIIDALGGATVFRLLQSHAPLTAQFADAIVDLVLQGSIHREQRTR
jgi:AcrR family transcriptional regulator